MRSLSRTAISAHLLLALLCVSLFAGALAGRARAQEEPTCVGCHEGLRVPRLRAPVLAASEGAHHGPGLSCPSCHLGDGREPTVRAHDPEAGFRPRPSPSAVSELCGRCHADPEAMRESGLPTDQVALHQRSAHGRALAGGHEEAASCVSCHGAHDVRRVTDPRSPVHPAAVANTCAGCHADAGRMARSGLPTTQQRQWQRSVHGRAFERGSGERGGGEREAPTCTGCHDAHGPAAGTAHGYAAVQACRGCHDEIAEAFARGPHAETFSRLGFVDCVECHGSHEIRPAAASLLGAGRSAACRRCHAEGQEAFERIRRMGRSVSAAERAFAEGAGGAADSSAVEARHRMILAIHALDDSSVRSEAEAIVRAAGGAPPSGDDETDPVSSGRRLSPVGWAVWISLALLALVGLGLGAFLLRRARGRRP